MTRERKSVLKLTVFLVVLSLLVAMAPLARAQEADPLADEWQWQEDPDVVWTETAYDPYGAEQDELDGAFLADELGDQAWEAEPAELDETPGNEPAEDGAEAAPSAEDDTATQAASGYAAFRMGDEGAWTILVNEVWAETGQHSLIEGQRALSLGALLSYAYSLDPSAALPPFADPAAADALGAPLYSASWMDASTLDDATYPSAQAAALLAAGYPNDATGLAQEFGLDDHEAYAATQQALWALVQGVDSTGDGYIDALLSFAREASLQEGGVSVVVYTPVPNGGGAEGLDADAVQPELDAQPLEESPEALDDPTAGEATGDDGEIEDVEAPLGTASDWTTYATLVSVQVDASVTFGAEPVEGGEDVEPLHGGEPEENADTETGEWPEDETGEAPVATDVDVDAEQDVLPATDVDIDADAYAEQEVPPAAADIAALVRDRDPQAEGVSPTETEPEPQGAEDGSTSIDGTADVEDGTTAAEGTAEAEDPQVDEQVWWPVVISAVDAQTGLPAPGAVLEIRTNTPDASLLFSFTSTSEPLETSLLPGEYLVVETAAPLEYDRADDVAFSLGADGSISVAAQTIDRVEVAHTAVEAEPAEDPAEIDGNDAQDAAGAEDAEGDAELQDDPVDEQAGDDTPSENEDAAAQTEPTEAAEASLEAEASVVEESPHPMRTTFALHDRDDPEQPVIGAVLQLIDASGQVVAQWTTGAEPVAWDLQAGAYSVHEVEGAQGYYPMVEDVSFELAEGMPDQTVRIGLVKLPASWSFAFDVVDADDGSSLAGAELALETTGGTVVDGWTTDGTQRATELEPGEYILRETQAPDGYDFSSDVLVAVSPTGELAVDGEPADAVRMAARRSAPSVWQVALMLVDESGAYVAGGSMQVVDVAGTVVASWTSTTEAHLAELAPGDYALRLATPPQDFDPSADVAFRIGADGTVQSFGAASAQGSVAMVATPSLPSAVRVSIAKTDAATGSALAGAQLQVLDETGKQVTLWTSSLQAHTAILTPGNYSLHELQAPQGYSRSADIAFTVARDGTLSSPVSGAVVGGTLVSAAASNQPPGPAEVQSFPVPAVLVDSVSKAPVGGAQLKIVDTAGSVITTLSSSTAPVEFQLPAGSYTLVNSAVPQGYERASSIPFVVAPDGALAGAPAGTLVNGVLTMSVAASQVPASGDKTPVWPVPVAAAGAAMLAAAAVLTRKGGIRPF